MYVYVYRLEVEEFRNQAIKSLFTIFIALCKKKGIILLMINLQWGLLWGRLGRSLAISCVVYRKGNEILRGPLSVMTIS